MREQKQQNSQAVSAAAEHDKPRRNTFISPHTGCLKADKIKMVDTEVRQTQLSNSSPDPASTLSRLKLVLVGFCSFFASSLWAHPDLGQLTFVTCKIIQTQHFFQGDQR